MRYFRYLVLFVILAVLVVAAMANRQMVALTVLPPGLSDVAAWNFSFELPLFLVVLGGIAIGLLLGYVLEWLREGKHRAEVSKRQRQVRNLNREVSRLREGASDGKDEVLAILDKAEPRKAS